MRSNRQSELILLLVSLFGIVFSVISLIVIFFLGMPGTDVNSKLSVPLSAPAPQSLISGGAIESAGLLEGQAGLGLPVLLKIPKIYVVAEVEQVGLTASGDVGVPEKPENVAWFRPSPLPGEKGSSVIDGHYGYKDGSVFDNLHKLSKGDKIYVENDKGELASFLVTGSKRYDPNADASEVFGSSDGKSHLNLITCEGIWNEGSKEYSKRLVVFTEKE